MRKLLSLRKRLATNNHKSRRHYHKQALREGYTARLEGIETNGRKHWTYTYCISIPLRESDTMTVEAQSCPEVLASAERMMDVYKDDLDYLQRHGD